MQAVAMDASLRDLIASITVVDGVRECEALVKQVLADEPVIGFDSEGVDLSRRGRLCLMQLYLPKSRRVVLVDTVGGEINMDNLRQCMGALLETAQVIKIMHDCREDSDALFHLAKVRLAGVIDLQVRCAAPRRDAHAHARARTYHTHAAQLCHSAIQQARYESHPRYDARSPFRPSQLPIGFARLLKRTRGCRACGSPLTRRAAHRVRGTRARLEERRPRRHGRGQRVRVMPCMCVCA